MRRAKKSGALGLWMNGQRVGTWSVTAQGEHGDPKWGSLL